MTDGRKRLVIVGNSPLPENARERIDAADAVMRFNQPPHSVEEAGFKTDVLFVSNAGNPMQRRLENSSYPRSPVFMAAKEVVFSYSPEVIRRYHPKPNLLSRLRGRKSDWTRQASALFEGAGKPVTIMSTQFYVECCEILGIAEAERRRLFPSSGFIGFRYGLQKFPAPEWSIDILGFTWEGWAKHPWKAEREWIGRHLSQ